MSALAGDVDQSSSFKSRLTVIQCVLLSTVLSVTSVPTAERLAFEWAPLIFLAPGETFYPSSVASFLNEVDAVPRTVGGISRKTIDSRLVNHKREDRQHLPQGKLSENWDLVTRQPIEELLKNSTSFLYGRNPKKYSVPVYAYIVPCSNPKNESNENVVNDLPYFQVTYWMFYPYNKGKAVCTVDMGRLGPLPIPKVNNHCWGDLREYANHVGDWEHVTMLFEGSRYPKKIYVSSHEVGAIYKEKRGKFVYESKEVRKGPGILQRPSFPPHIKMSGPGKRPVFFAANGSHGLWASPGKHGFVRLPRLYDTTGFGEAWATWRHLVLLRADSTLPGRWMGYHGRWGNPKSKCHPVSVLGLPICEIADGPTGIPTKKLHFQCS